MTEPIGPSSAPMQPAASQAPNVPLLSKQMQSQALLLANQLQKILEEPSLSTQASFLQEVAGNGQKLNETIEQANLVR